MRRYCTPMAMISVSDGSTKMVIKGAANTQTPAVMMRQKMSAVAMAERMPACMRSPFFAP